MGSRTWPLVMVGVAVALSVAGCADDADADADLNASRAQLSDGPDPNGLLGLEVTSVGEVSEILDNNAFRIDKDGTDAPTGSDLDEDDFTRGDDEFDIGVDEEQAMVLVPDADLDLSVGDPVRISGTLRSLDAEAIEEVYGVEIDTDAFEPHLNQLVIIAETVSPAA